MTTRAIAAALERVKTVLRRRPDMGLQDDVPASARWEGGLRVVASHANGTLVATDMPVEVGGTGDRVSPGWMFRAGIASCAATTLAMAAAVEGIELERLEVDIRSRSDARGLFGMADEHGARVLPHAREIALCVRIAARGVPRERLREFVERSLACSPMPSAVTHAVPLALTIEIA
jgi:uncharacterized OsmC-like protein